MRLLLQGCSDPLWPWDHYAHAVTAIGELWPVNAMDRVDIRSA